MYYINRYNNLNEVVIIIKWTRIAMMGATGAQAYFMLNFLSSLTGLRRALTAIKHLDFDQFWGFVGFVISSYLLFCIPLVAIALLFSESKKIQKIGAWVGIFSIIPWIIFLTIISPFLFWGFVGFVISSYLLFCIPLVAIALLFSESKKIQKIGAWVGIFSIIPWIIFLTIISPFLFWGFDIFIILGWWIGVISCVVMFVAAILTLTKLPSKGKTKQLRTDLNLINI
ncbi:hypothetical protein [Spiroplasma endosymbiont of Panorpa germanica]|uniref:hypothetical protein n=1 Tax=Spiroplasma endosymbiont of Panorpa germanica TaxID=3066314 RepID=UPI0030CFC5D8